MTKYDYVALKKEFVEGPEISIRGLAEKHGISAWSTLNDQAVKGEWRKAREEFQRTLEVKTMENVTSAIAQKRATVIADALDVIHAAVFKMAQDMQDHWVADPTNPGNRVFVPGIVITPDSLSKLLDRVLTMTGSASVITESHTFDHSPDLPADIARVIADIAGARAATARPVGQAALPSRRKPD